MSRAWPLSAPIRSHPDPWPTRLRRVRALVVSNMEPSADAPQRGSFVRDQVAALRGLGLEVDEFMWPPGSSVYPRATRKLKGLIRDGGYDVVHAHYGLAGWCAALAGAEPLVVTFHGTDVRHRVVGPLSRLLARRQVLVAGASKALFRPESGRPGLPMPAGRSAVLPCGAKLERFGPVPRGRARSELGLDPSGRYLLFPADPARRVKRHDRAQQVAARADARLLNLGGVDPARVPLMINAAAAVLITSDNEGFGLGAVEALACDVPVISTRVGAVPLLAGDLDGCLVAEFELGTFARFAGRHLDAPDPRVGGRRRAEAFGATRTAERVAEVYRDLLGFA